MEVKRNHEAFSVGSLVVPARNGLLKSLGHDVAALGHKALGLVAESRPAKCFVQFPELGLSLWLGRDEIADVEERKAAGDTGYASLLPAGESSALAEFPLVTWIWLATHRLPVTHLLNIERGPLREVWSDEASTLADYFEGSPETEAWYVALGVSELKLHDWRATEKILGDRLLFARFMPAGMHKLEVALYLRA